MSWTKVATSEIEEWSDMWYIGSRMDSTHNDWLWGDWGQGRSELLYHILERRRLQEELDVKKMTSVVSDMLGQYSYEKYGGVSSYRNTWDTWAGGKNWRKIDATWSIKMGKIT